MLFNTTVVGGNDRAHAPETVVPTTTLTGFQSLPINLSREEIRALVRESLG